MAFDTYVVFPKGEIKGESTAKGFKDAFEIYSFSFGASNPITIGTHSGGASAGKVSVSSFNVMKKTDSASAQLFLNCCTGTHAEEMEVHCRKATGTGGQQDFLTYKFKGVFIESIQWSGSSGGDDTPTESVSFAFSKVEITYKKQDAKGALTAAGDVSWDLTQAATK
jgi:type VI secretion system secreted protein Hcp